MINAEQGNSKGYTLSRLNRDHPELYDRVIAGELSANAAAIEAPNFTPNGVNAESTPTWSISEL
jgi:hypothetical protein